MNYKKLEIPDVILFEPDVFEDDRGFFLETWKQKLFHENTDTNYSFVQDNSSFLKPNE